MKHLLDFFIEAQKLNKMPKKGWILIGIKDPETISNHTFRLAIMAWVLGKGKTDLKIERLIIMALVHDLCEVYAGDMTPYDSILPKDKKKWPELFDRWPRFSQTEKIKRFLEKNKREYKALLKLVSKLPSEAKEEILGLWLDYQQGLSRFGRFVKQLNRMETLLQALEYAKATKRRAYKSWWIGSQELIDDPLLVEFMKELDKKFYRKQKTKPVLDFLIEVGKLKRLPRRGWVARRIKEPETVADHSFLVTLMVWLLGRKKRINLQRALKMALIHEICAVYAGDYTPHDTFRRFSPPVRYDILGPRWPWKKFWQQKPRLKAGEKIKRFRRIYRRETKALQTLIKKLPADLREEILTLWTEFNEKKTKEGDFVDQVNCLATFLQACQYWQEDKKFPIKVFGQQVGEFISDPELVEFLGAIGKKFRLKI
jgi:putative hydrolase of HD superfamily